MIFTTDPAYASLALEPDPFQQAEDAQLYRRVLHDLLHIGTDLARILQAQATAHAHAAMQNPTPPKPSLDAATAFDRIARAVRRTITLARSLNEPVAPAPDHTARHSAAIRTPTLREVGQDAAGHADATPGHDDSAKDAAAPSAALRDRPDAPDRDAPDCDIPDCDAPDRDEDDTGRPPAAVIADICRDLGLDAPPGTGAWKQRASADRTPADIKPPCARAAAPSSAAASSTHQPGPGPRSGLWPHGPRHNATQHLPDPQPDERDPSKPAATPSPQPSPIHAGSSPPDDPAPAIATNPHRPTHIQERWRPPPNG